MVAGEKVINGWCAIPSSVSAETMAHQAFDSVTVDMQHGLIDYQCALTMLQAISQTQATPLCRVPWLEPGIIMKMLDAGAYGVICPMVNIPQDAHAFVSACSYAPDGMRSFGPTRAVVYGGADYAQHANRSMLKLAMIETKQAVANMEAIMATPGLSGVYIGPSDLSLSYGYTPKLDHDEPAVLEIIGQICECAKRHGILAGIHCLSPAYAKRMHAEGFDMVTLASDNRLIAAGAAEHIALVRASDAGDGPAGQY
ncbi:MAG: 2,4-dihydroxyhept-2-ene-1,7-dioic acid aldolase [Gammaproteobacteria bacterium]|nr:2,4-dihydroxyhept-2-ene-1,7-dioic acid aldolase [Gammaproteobacteria bacterium]